MGLLRFVMRIFKIVFPCATHRKRHDIAAGRYEIVTPTQPPPSRVHVSPCVTDVSADSSVRAEGGVLPGVGQPQAMVRSERELELERELAAQATKLEDYKKYIRTLEDEMAVLQDAVRQSVETLETPQAKLTGSVLDHCPVPMVFDLSPYPEQCSHGASDISSDGTSGSQDSNSSCAASTIASPSFRWIHGARPLGKQPTAASQRSPLMEVSNTTPEVSNTTPNYASKAADKNSLVTPPHLPFVLSGSASNSENQTPQVVGVPNTSSKYKESANVRVHETPFEKRVDRTLREAELYRQQLNPA